MPIYVYRCESGHEYERRQGFSASTVDTCPTCNTEARRKLFSPAVIYKGSGFYTTDYARKKVVPAGESSNESSDNGQAPAEDGHSHDNGDHGHSHGPSKSESLAAE